LNFGVNSPWPLSPLSAVTAILKAIRLTTLSYTVGHLQSLISLCLFIHRFVTSGNVLTGQATICAD